MKKILKFPNANKQINSGSCGPNSIKHVILYKKGLDIPEQNLINMSCCSEKTGAAIKDLARVADNFNLNYFLKHNSSIEDIISSLNKNNPAILLIQDWGSTHYIVANGYDTKFNKIFYYDPFDGKTKPMNYTTLNRVWKGLDVFKRNKFGMFFKD